MRNLLCVAALSALTGCASIVSGHNQSISLEARTAVGEPLVGAICNLKNDKGEWFITSPGSTTVRRSYEDLGVRCQKDPHEPGMASVASTTKGMAFGNVLFGGVIGVGVDVATGAAYDYPPLFTVTMGKSTAIGGRPAVKTPADLAQGRINGTGSGAWPAPAAPAAPPIPAPVAPPAPPPAPVVAALPVVVAPPPPPAPVPVAAVAPPAPPLPANVKFLYQAERHPEVRACGAVVSLASAGPGFENYTARCASGNALAVRCEFGNCRVLK